MYSRILVPVDMTNVDKLGKALDIAADTARKNDATIVYVSVVDAVPTTSSHTEGEKLKEELDLFAKSQSKAHGIQATDQVVLRGDLHLHVGKDVIAAASDTDCDLIVMASHIPGIKDHIFSSNAGYVATHAPMSVYVVR